jgi:hypothetical protein
MLKRGMQMWRSHPVLVAAVVGAIFGAVNALLLEAGGFLHRNSTGVLPLLLPAVHSPRVGVTDAMQTELLLLIEFGGNIVGFSLLFVVPVALFVRIRRVFAGQKRAAPPEERP